MSHTNATTNYSLPQFVTTDKPAWLTDINNAYLAIDTAMNNNATAAATADGKGDQALLDAAAADTKATNAKNAADGALADIANAYLATDTYALNDLVIYNSLLYKCTTAISTPEAWDSTHWTRVTIEDQLNTKASTSALATVATTGSYNDLSNKPSIPDIAYSGTLVRQTDSAGYINLTYGELNVSGQPKVIVITNQSYNDAINFFYNYDTNRANVAIRVFDKSGNPLTNSGLIRFCLIVIE